jgi:hypothetical protein
MKSEAVAATKNSWETIIKIFNNIRAVITSLWCGDKSEIVALRWNDMTARGWELSPARCLRE